MTAHPEHEEEEPTRVLAVLCAASTRSYQLIDVTSGIPWPPGSSALLQALDTCARQTLLFFFIDLIEKKISLDG
jgi:hypothetical protein